MGKGYVDDNYFGVINTEDKAYFIGFIMADGCILKGSHTQEYVRIGLHVNIKDIDIVEKFKYFTKSTNKIFIGDRFNDCALRFVSKQMVKDLGKYGIVPLKTGNETLITENIPYNLLRHTVRGLIDGDGWISFGNYQGREISSIGLCGSYNICNFVQSYLFSELGVGPLKVSKVKDKNCYKISYSSVNDQRKIAYFLYNNSNIYLDRKYELAENIMY